MRGCVPATVRRSPESGTTTGKILLDRITSDLASAADAVADDVTDPIFGLLPRPLVG